MGDRGAERLRYDVYASVVSVNSSREVLELRPEALSVLQLRDVDSTDLGEPGESVQLLNRAT